MQTIKAPHVLWLTENYFPNTGGMAQSCDRIVQGLRNAGLNIGLVHFRSTKFTVRMKVVNRGFNLVIPVADDEAHSYNILSTYLNNPDFHYQFTHIVAFGGYLPVLGAPVLAGLLDIPLITLLRGNDFDVALFSPRKREMLIYALNNSETVCTVTKEHAEKIQKLFKHTDIRYIPNGIDISDWLPHKSETDRANNWKKEHVPENKKVIGIFGHLKPKKGIDFFIDSIVRSDYAESLFLLITGEIYPEISQKLESSGIQFHLSPFMDRYELLAWYPVCDAVAIPSFYDGMPNVLLEAAALGIPLIASNVGGMKDMLRDGEHGFLFHPGDEEACSGAITRFIKLDYNELKQIGHNAKQLVINQYNSEVEIQNYLKIFQKVSIKLDV